MIIKLLKWFFFTIVVLLLGQIPLFGHTIGEHVLHKAKQVVELSQESISHSTYLGSMTHFDWLKRAKSFLGAKPVGTKTPSPARNPKTTEGEDYTPSDREAILKVLE